MFLSSLSFILQSIHVKDCGKITCTSEYIIYLVGVHDRTEFSMKHLSAVIRMLVRRMLRIEARTSAVNLGF